MRRTRSEWEALFQAHENSGLNAAAFCREQGLDPKYFSLRKKQLGWQPSSAFTQVVLAHYMETHEDTPESTLTLKCDSCTLSFDCLPEPTWLAELMGRLS